MDGSLKSSPPVDRTDTAAKALDDLTFFLATGRVQKDDYNWEGSAGIAADYIKSQSRQADWGRDD